MVSRGSFGAWAASLVLAAGCAEDGPSLTTATLSSPLSSPSGAGPSGGDDDDPSNDDPTGDATSGATGGPTSAGTASGDPTDGGDDTTGGAPPPSMATCARYLDCLAVIHPEDLPAAQQGFGPNGTCWDGPPESQDQCVMACEVALAELHTFYPDEPACHVCQDPAADCGPDMVCEAGDCVPAPVPGCGDGLVAPEETCDEPYCFDDCQAAPCNPLSNTGCAGDDECRFAWYGPDTGVMCLPPADLPKDGYGCQYEPQVGIDYCAFGLVCAPAYLITGCEGTGCCTRLCDLQGPDECPNGRVCVAFPDELYYYSTYVGVCVLP